MPNFVTNIPGCIESSTQLMHGNLNLVYYSHIPVAIIAFFIGFFVIIKNKKDLSARVMFFLSMMFALWVINNLVAWVSPNSISVYFSWSIFTIINSLLFLSCLYLVFVYKNEKDMPVWFKIVLGFLFLPILLLTPTTYNMGDFNYTYCYPVDNAFLNYFFYFEIIIAIIIGIVAIWRYIISSKELKHEIVLIFVGTTLFLLSIFGTGYIADTFQRYDIEVYGIFTMPLFLGFLAYLIVKYKAFNIKLIAAQALVWATVILIGSEFLFVDNLTNQILVGVTLVISSVLGLILVRSVKKEVALREQLEVANAGQTNLIHIMNHQIKGYLGIDKNIFAELLTDDYGKVPEEAKDIISKGLENSDKGQKYVTDILRGASAENGTLTYDMKVVDFKNLVSEAVIKGKEVAEKKGLKFEFNVSNGDYNIFADATHLGEAVRNLVDNSIYYTPSGSVSVNLSVRGKVILLKIKDTGVGIKESDKDRMFRAGGVGKDSIKVNVNSSGYGLVFAKNVIEKHNGRIWYESVGEGKGTTFFAELPRK